MQTAARGTPDATCSWFAPVVQCSALPEGGSVAHCSHPAEPKMNDFFSELLEDAEQIFSSSETSEKAAVKLS